MGDNRAFFAILLSWIAAQLAKFIIARIKQGDFFSGRAMKTGGMPSAHIALVSSLAYCAGAMNGLGSIEFLTALVLTVIVGYDAMGMRKEFHSQSKLLLEIAAKVVGGERLLKDYPNLGDYEGHEFAEIAAGLALGVAVSAIILNL